MPLYLYNTLTRQKEEFIPHHPDQVTLYTCGPTVYHYVHLGNLRTYIFEDILEKTLQLFDYDVKRVLNITDVGHLQSDADTGEDKMLLGAKREQKTVEEIADYYTQAFFKDMDRLNLTKPKIIIKASDEINQYIKIITGLIKDDYAYQAGGNVYFDTSKIDNYYNLTNQTENLLVGARDDVEADHNKRNPSDFVLWFTKSKFEDQAQVWDSPWGVGYPGWHIECTGISLKYLGPHLDIHCGGVDNIFPHHTNEIAQSEAYLGHPWCKYWLHAEHLGDQTGKMSKSKGEFLTLDLLIQKGYDPLAYKFFCLGSHYRNQLIFTYESLDTAKQSYLKLKNKIKEIIEDGSEFKKQAYDFYQNQLKTALSDDLNTSNALTVLYDLLKDKDLNNTTKLALIKDFDEIFALDLLKAEELTLTEEQKQKIKERAIAKQNKDFELADKIRNELKNDGIVLKDTKDGTTIRSN